MTKTGQRLLEFFGKLPGGDVYGWLYASEYEKYGIVECEELEDVRIGGALRHRICAKLVNGSRVVLGYDYRFAGVFYFYISVALGSTFPGGQEYVTHDAQAQLIFDEIRKWSEVK